MFWVEFFRFVFDLSSPSPYNRRNAIKETHKIKKKEKEYLKME